MDNKVKFKIGEIEFEAVGTAEVIERERNVFLTTLLPAAVDAIVRTRGEVKGTQYISADAQQATLEMNPDNSTPITLPKKELLMDLSRTSLSSFINEYGDIGDQDFVLIAAYYDEKKNGISSFSSESVMQYYSDARRTKYSNISALLRLLTKKGLIMDDPKAEKQIPKLYILTAKGIDYVENYQPKEAKEKKPAKQKKDSSKSKSRYEGINVDDLNLRNYPDVKSLHDFKEKMMLILYIITNEQAGEWFTTTDVLYLMTDVFGEAASKGQINGVFKREKLWFKVENMEGSNRDVKRKLLNKGIDFAQNLTTISD